MNLAAVQAWLKGDPVDRRGHARRRVMRSVIWLASGLVLGVLGIWAVRSVAGPAAEPPKPPKAVAIRWEYKALSECDIMNLVPRDANNLVELEKGLAQLGNEGWELVSVTSDRLDKWYYFKRPK